MLLRDKKVIIIIIDFFIRFLFFIPLLIRNIFIHRVKKDPNNILIMELWGIGDLVMMSSILKILKTNFPKAKITLLSKVNGRVIFGDVTYIDDFIEFDFPWTHFKGKYKFWNWSWRNLFKVIMQLRKSRFDLAFDGHGDIRNNLLLFLSSAKRTVGSGIHTGGGYFLTDNVTFDSKVNHRIETWSSLLNHIGLDTDNAKPYLFVSEEDKVCSEKFLNRHGVGREEFIVGIHPGAGIKTRCWSIDKFARVAEYLRDIYGAKIIVFIEPDGYGENIPIKGEYIKAKVILKEIIALIKSVQLLVCNDSGAMHIATAVNTSVLAIFGPGAVDVIGPYGLYHTVVIKDNMQCRPCFDNCRYDKPMCIDNITISDVIRKVDEKMATFKRLTKR
ncbi:MAG: glycosyltransferase family 9 protein [Parcubacteria group bacterium]|nr:glycosyltransferase family 9 protein [Parcubacteria group bacterium]